MTSCAADRVLVIDDDVLCRRMLRKLLERAAFEVTEAADGAEGFERILAGEASIVITDWEMPGMDGLSLIRRVRETELAWYPYMLLLTASHEERQGLETGADDFISKPIREDLLLPRLRAAQRIMSLQERLRERNIELNAAVDQLRSLSVKDPLTGLLNRRAALEAGQREWRRCQRYEVPLSCLMLDIDHFKRVNDTYGHPAGDAVIKRLGQALSEGFRATDVISRHGGEEFCLLLVETPPDKAALLARRLLDAVRAIRMPEVAPDFRFTVSCGVASRTLNMVSVESLIDEADQALLMAKRSGRDRYVMFDELASLPTLMDEANQTQAREDRSALAPDPALVPFQVVNTLLAALRYRDPDTVEHTQRVAETCREFAQFLGLAPEERALLEVAALLHDVGRLATPDAILAKSGRLTDEEFAVAQQHHIVTVDLLKACFTNKRLVDVVQGSWQWYDGSRGAPAGGALPQAARMLAIANVFDDILWGRSWWGPHTEAEALERLLAFSGTQLDSDLVEQFMAQRGERSLAPA